MELKDFVTVTIKQIIEGVIDAQEVTKGTKALVSPYGRHVFITTTKENIEHSFGIPDCLISFDVVVSSSESEEAKGGIGVVVVGFGIGGQAKSESGFSAVNRVKFDIPIVLPFQENKHPEIPKKQSEPHPLEGMKGI